VDPAKKVCRICDTPRDRSEFYSRPGARDGLRSDCKDCTKDRAANCPSKLAQKAAAAERRAARIPFDPAAYKAAWHQENRGRMLALGAIWRDTNQEKMRAYRRKWQKLNLSNGRQTSAAYLARKLGTDVRLVTQRDLRRLIQRHHGLCAYCQIKPWQHIDHVIPLARGGRHSIGNLLPACQDCNQSKGARLLADWRNRRLSRAA
jgi:hypothetical protein